MKRLFIVLGLLCSPLYAATWFATSSSVNINAVGLWVPTSTGSCTGSGTALVFGAQAAGDVFDANGCTALAVNVDPGSVSVQVTLQTNSTNGGGFTYATATNITIHANILATKTTALAITGSTNGGTISGNITGGPTTSTQGVNDTHTVVTMNVIGNITGGSASASSVGYQNAAGPLAVTGNVSSGSFGVGLSSNNNGNISVAGNCIGADANISSFGCNATSNGTITVTGKVINGKQSPGAAGRIILVSTSTGYVCFPLDSSYAIGTEDCEHTGGGAGLSAHAIEFPINPTAAKVQNGTVYGSFTGTLTGGASANACTSTWQ